MSFHRRMTRPDSAQGPIVSALRSAGISVWIIGEPCDLLTYYAPLKRWRPLEVKPAPEPGVKVKTRAIRHRNDQEGQKAFVTTYAVPIVRTPQEALQAVTDG